jgi:hypothetical protein
MTHENIVDPLKELEHRSIYVIHEEHYPFSAHDQDIVDRERLHHVVVSARKAFFGQSLFSASILTPAISFLRYTGSKRSMKRNGI